MNNQRSAFPFPRLQLFIDLAEVNVVFLLWVVVLMTLKDNFF